MNRTHWTLLGLLLLQVVLIALFRSPFSSASTRSESRPLLPELGAISPDRLEIDGANDERITLRRQGDGWAIEELGGFPADSEKVDRLLDDLEAIAVRRPVVRGRSHHAAFKITDDDNEARLRLWDSGSDEARVDLIVGSSANYRTTHVRLGGQDEVYEIQGLAAYDVRPSSGTWIRKELVDDVGDGVDRLVLQNGQGRFELVKREGIWSVAAPADRRDEELDQDEVVALLRVATGLRLAEGVGPVDEAAQGLGDPAASLVLGWSAGDASEGGAAPDELTLAIGSQVADEANQRYVTSSGLGFAGTIWESSVRRLLDDTLDDLRVEADAG